MSEEQTFRSKVNGSLPPSGHRSSVGQDEARTYNGEALSSEKDFETLQLGAFATPGLLLARGPVGLTAESGLSSSRRRSAIDAKERGASGVASRNPRHRSEQRTPTHERRDGLDLIFIEPNTAASVAAIEGKVH